MTGFPSPGALQIALEAAISRDQDPAEYLAMVTLRNRTDLGKAAGITTTRMAQFAKGKKPTRVERSALLWAAIASRPMIIDR